MRRSIVKTALATPITPPKPVRFCVREGCKNELAPSHRKYCSHVCRNLVLSGGNGGGERPEHPYKEEYAGKKMEEYLALCQEHNESSMVPTKTGYIIIHNARIPMLEDYAEWLGVKDNSFYTWEASHPEFAQALDRLIRLQKLYLVNNGLNGRYNPAIAKLSLNFNHGMVERSIIDNNHKLLGLVKHVYEEADKLEKS